MPDDIVTPCPSCGAAVAPGHAHCDTCDADRGGATRRDREQRGPLIFLLGALSLAGLVLLVTAPVSLALGAAAAAMARGDLDRPADDLDPRGAGLTLAGRACGLVGAALAGLLTLGGGTLAALAVLLD